MKSYQCGSFATLLCAIALSAGCKDEKAAVIPPRPMNVTVSQPVVREVADFVEFTGTVSAIASVDIRARVKGFLRKIDFIEGSTVKAGDLLFEIEVTAAKKLHP